MMCCDHPIIQVGRLLSVTQVIDSQSISTCFFFFIIIIIIIIVVIIAVTVTVAVAEILLICPPPMYTALSLKC